MNLSQPLIELGLDDKQAKVYLHMLKHKKGADLTAFLIAKGTALPRSTVYLALQELESKKLVSSYKKNNVLRYLSADPSRLSRDLEEKQSLLDSVLPLLQGLSKDASHTSSVQTYTGAEGVKIVIEDVYNNPHLKGIRELHTISHPKLADYMPKILPQRLEYKKKLGIFTKMIVPGEFEGRTPKNYASDSHRETRFMPGKAFQGTTIVYGKKVALFSHRDDDVYSMIIDSPAIAEMMDHVFTCLWNLLPPNPAK
ncbi:MAG TPA: helix-turn-helix domain-containing protein [Candidatus Paceibacterota bacterium]